MHILDNLNFLVLCVNTPAATLRISTASIRTFLPQSQIFALVPQNAHQSEVDELSQCCSVHRGQYTITSLMDKGMQTSASLWNFILMAGSRITKHLMEKYEYFVRQETDVLYPVVNNKIPFDEASINGILLNRKFYDQVGPFGNGGTDIEVVKLCWALDAIAQGGQFKGIVGAKLF